MKKICYLILFMSCSSHKITKVAQDPEISAIEKTKNSDFFLKKAVPKFHTKKQEYYSDETYYINHSAESKNELSNLSKKCHQGEEIKFDGVHRKYRHHESYWTLRANCYFLNEKYGKAQILYEKALSKNKRYSPAYNNLGVLSFKNEDYHDALDYFKKAIKYNSKMMVPKFNLGLLYTKFSFYKKAKRVFNQIRNKNKDILSKGQLSILDFLEGNLKKSKKGFETLPLSKMSDVYKLYYFMVLRKLKDPKANEVRSSIKDTKLLSRDF